MKKEEKIKKETINNLDSEEMNEKQMNGLLVQLFETPYWQAILKKVYLRDADLIGGLATVDAFKEPNRIAKMQGERDGLYYLDNEIRKQIERMKKIEKGENPDEGLDLPKY